VLLLRTDNTTLRQRVTELEARQAASERIEQELRDQLAAVAAQ